jgi:hypothetical protein
MSQVYNAREVIDAFGKYNPTIQCECIDNRTLTNINHSLKILYNDKMREQKELEKDIDRLSQLEHDAMNINKLVMTRTESLIEVLKDIKPCKEK